MGGHLKDDLRPTAVADLSRLLPSGHSRRRSKSCSEAFALAALREIGVAVDYLALGMARDGKFA